jgi:hypothetical protein
VLTVPPGTLVPVSLPAAPAPAAGRRRAPPSWALVQAAGGSIVAARGLFVPVGTHGHVAPVGFPQVVLGSPAPAAQWLVRGPVAPPASAKGSQVGGTLTIGAPESTASGARPFIVHVWELGTVPSSGPPRARRRLSVVPITPGTVQQITLPPGASTADWGGLLVLAAKPVFVEVGYAGGGSAGVTSGPNADSMGVPAA